MTSRAYLMPMAWIANVELAAFCALLPPTILTHIHPFLHEGEKNIVGSYLMIKGKVLIKIANLADDGICFCLVSADAIPTFSTKEVKNNCQKNVN